jgi:Transposase DDE domain group 1
VTGHNFYAPADVSLPAAVSVFPDEYVQAPRSWTEQAYHNLIYFNQADRGGHFAAWEPKRLRLRLFSAAGRLVRGGRRLQLRLAATWPWAPQLTAAITRLQACAPG